MPDDTTPHGGEALHPLPDRARIPADPQGPEARVPRLDPAERPTPPEHPTAMAADIEDEEADPVVESGPGVARESGKPSVTRQPA